MFKHVKRPKNMSINNKYACEKYAIFSQVKYHHYILKYINIITNYIICVTIIYKTKIVFFLDYIIHSHKYQY